MSSETRLYLACALYGALVLGGVALVGFVVAPLLGSASGLFAIDTESAAFFSWLTLKGSPYWAGLGVATAPLYGSIASRGAGVRIAVYAANVALAWSVGAGIAFLDLE